MLIELKRGQTPWEVVAQALDYASWVEQLEATDIAGMYRRFKDGRNLAEDLRAHSGTDLDEDQLNQTHQIVIVAADLDDSTERITRYLSDRVTEKRQRITEFEVESDEGRTARIGRTATGRSRGG